LSRRGDNYTRRVGPLNYCKDMGNRSNELETVWNNFFIEAIVMVSEKEEEFDMIFF